MPASRLRAARRRHEQSRRLDTFHAEFKSLYREYRAVSGAGLTAQSNSARITEKIVELFGDIEKEGFQLVKFVERVFGLRPPADTAAAGDHEEFTAIAFKIAESRSRLPVGRPSSSKV